MGHLTFLVKTATAVAFGNVHHSCLFHISTVYFSPIRCIFSKLRVFNKKFGV